MKRMKAISSMFVILAAALLFSAPAIAQTITCTTPLQRETPPQYPDVQNAFSCTNSTPSNGILMVEGVQLAAGRNELARAGVTYYLFHDYSDYTSWALANSLVPVEQNSAYPWGVTAFNAQETPTYSAIFEANGTVNNPSIEHAAAREVGLALNYLMGYVVTRGVILPTPFPVSESPDYGTERSEDLTHLNSVTPQCGSGGLFAGHSDENSVPICSGNNLSTKYAGQNNMSIVQNAYPSTFGSSNQASLFAEEAATIKTSINSSTSPDYLLTITNRMGCTGSFGYWLTSNGTMPVLSNLAMNAGCQAPVITTVCYKLWSPNLPANWPSGNVFNCGGTTDLNAHNVLTGLRMLGALGKGEYYSPIKNLLNGRNSNIFVFPTAADYDNLFDPLFTDGSFSTMPTIALGESYRDYQIWYTIVNEAAITSSITSTPNELGVAEHELGHVVDEGGTPQYSASATFNAAMQNDFVDLDWWTLGTSSVASILLYPCGHSGGGLGTYTGPLANNIIDDQSKNPFCTGMTIEPTPWGENNPATGRLWQAGDILRTDSPYFYTQQPQTKRVGYNPDSYAVPGWTELYAEAFATVADKDTLGRVNDTIEKVVLNGYLQCATGPNGWVSQIYANPTGVPSLNASCGASNLPTWWVQLK